MTGDKKVVNLGRSSLNCAECRLHELCLPRDLGHAQLCDFSESIRHGRLLPRGQTLYRQGEPLANIHVVKTGSVKTYFSASDGAEQVVGFYLAGDIIGLDGIENERHDCSAVTLEQTSLCELSWARMELLCQRYPALLRELFGKLGAELNRDHRLRLLISQRGAEERLSTFLVEHARRLAERGFCAVDLSLSMSRYDIANYLGVAAETVSRTFTRFEQQGLLAVDRRHVRVLDDEGLRRAAGQRSAAQHPARASAATTP